jgi:hypothetical protein
MNVLQINDLRKTLRDKDHPTTCWHCSEHVATDVHHLNGVHHDNMPANLEPWCKRCHNTHHGISDNLTMLGLLARQFSDVQVQRVALGNRLIAYAKLGYHAEIADKLFKEFEALEADIGKGVAKMLKSEPVYTLYLSHIMGVGPTTSAQVIAAIGDPGRFDTISALWAYAGLDVRDGKASKNTKGVTSNWNAGLRMTVVGRLVPSFVKQKGKQCLGRDLYEQYKAFYTARDGATLTPLHIENRAKRKVAKVFLSCLWVAWRRIKGLPVSKPFAMDKLNHTHLVTPEDWAGEGWEQGAVQPMLAEAA